MRMHGNSQLPLWVETKVGGNGLKDPTANGNKSLSIHRWVNWIAGFSADFVDSVMERYLADLAPLSATVLDPFAGVGTTNVEALRQGFHTFGFEINPFAALAARCKLRAAQLDKARFDAAIDRYVAFMAGHELEVDQWYEFLTPKSLPYRGSAPHSPVPGSFRSREPFFSPAVELKVRFTLDFIRSCEDPAIQEYFWLALGATLVSYSSYSYEPSLSSRKRLGKPLVGNTSVAAAIAIKLRGMADDMLELQRELAGFPLLPQGRIVHGSFFEAPKHLDRASIDLLVTSPPYLNNYHYVRNTRPQLYWLGLIDDPKDTSRLEAESFGKFWQTVRQEERVDICFSLPSLEAQVQELRSVRPERGIYGGNGWANYAACYFNDSYRFLALVRNLLKRGGHGVIVVGNSLLQGIEFRVDEILAEIAGLHGLAAEIERVRSKRVGDSIVGTGLRQQPQNGRPELYEAAVIVGR